MNDRYTERAKRVLYRSLDGASQLGAPAADPAHVLSAMLGDLKGVTARVFARFNVDTSLLRARLGRAIVPRERLLEYINTPQSAAFSRVLGHAAEEADAMNHDYIGVEHLLLGLLQEESSTACQLLNEHGVTLQPARDAIVEVLRGPS